MLHTHHAPIFVALSVLVAVFGSWTALDLFRRVRSHIGRTRRFWLAAAAVCMGASIWSMHFIAMLGFDPGSPVSYDLTLTLASLALAIGATSGAFFVAASERAAARHVFFSGGAMGAGICLMHYVGMAALKTAVSLGYEPRLVALSFIVAVAAATAALFAARRERSFAWRAAAAVILGLAVVGMHYTAMAALRITPAADGVDPLPGAPPLVLGVGVAAGTLMILFLALLASLYDQRLNVLAAVEAGGVGYWELVLPDGELHVSARGKEIFGRPAAAPFTREDMIQALAPEERPRREAMLKAVMEERAPYDAVYRIQRPDGTTGWVNIRGRVVDDPRGRSGRLSGVVLDVTDRQQAFAALAAAERAQRLLINELNHRVKNTLATVQSIARQTAKGATSVDDFRRAFDARIIALSETHNALTRGGWRTAGLRGLLENELRPYAGDQIRLVGGDIGLPPAQALALGMIFHELATNAAKYGALAVPGGRLTVRWRDPAEAGGVLELDWIESGGPRVVAPERRGFGSALVERSLRALGGRSEIVFAPGGVRCQIRLPLTAGAEIEWASETEPG